jgi:hypothetical protein
MTLPASGPISFNQINVELGVAGTTSASLGQTSYRTLAGVPSGTISMSNFYGKSNRKAISYTFTASTANASLNVAAISGYVAGVSDITVTVNTSVYLYSTGTGTPGLTLSGGTTGDTLTLVNNGFIMGMGGGGANSVPNGASGGAGGIALQLGYPTTINNTNPVAYIGGGGGGGASRGPTLGGGGGGAGGAPGGNGGNFAAAGGAGGGIGASGANAPAQPNGPGGFGRGGGSGGSGGAYVTTGRTSSGNAGGGGGRIFPGVGGALAPSPTGSSGAGGSANAAGGSTPSTSDGAGGGGGWGASGGTTAKSPGGSGGAGGRAVFLNGRTVTWVSGNTTRVYGAVS